MEVPPNLKDKPVIAIDIDDVIAESALGFVAWSNQKYGTHLTIDDYQEHWGGVWKTEYEETRKRALAYHASGHQGTYLTVTGADEVLKQLKKRFKLIVLTARRTSIKPLTHKWIEEYYPNIFDDFIFAGFFDNLAGGASDMTKAELAKSIQADYIIDDQLKHVLSAAEIGIQGILFGDYSWNKADVLPKNVTRVKNWHEVLNYFVTR